MEQYLKTNADNPMEYISGGLFVSNEPWIHSKRNLNSYEIIIGVRETLYIQQEEEKFEVCPGDVLLLLPHHTHQGYALCSPGVSFYWFHFYCPNESSIIDYNTMEDEVISYRTNPDSHRSSTDIFIPIYSSPKEIERINILFNQLLDIDNANYYNKRSTDYFMTSLLIEISEQSVTHFITEREHSKSEKNLVNIVEWIRINAMSNISVTAIAQEFNYNQDYLSRIFKKKNGMNIQKYIHILKLSKAKDMLTSTNLSIKEIANIVGIFDEKYFMKLFKKYEKVTPTEFRKAYYRVHLNNK
ncbi:AraC family transcriptional regulator [Heyndrickxia shackletonii]|uniref:AraC family transcriptional regulator n=1 Tax=Heyndrickxia shackletonii TaxID=157838 RepID=A0A0Q3TFP7_9BACI|nr:AraC family transcriptional regulator [Heyndrickxia shackletonii]KQL52862.1 AraC family transcriptional regulator [Heyndrickxia shackletonii]MBB2480711.1 helix-turn-helix transcriptional regulator [Bacillus sp. APMAM]NEZ00371.1 AraC family transcriptional regulator [Heyndrickxia shackletonii]RTZ55959.1 AraC family transcriptional regulator [Bacillus sp. SAJ1]